MVTRRLAAGVSALVLAWLAINVPPTDGFQPATTCTGWQSATRPPPSIRVHRTATNTTVTVAFRQYVRTVMASEWGPMHPRAALQAGAVAIKQYAWYYAIHWRGGTDSAGRCFDVVDTVDDQVFDPSRRAAPNQVAAIEDTWSWFLLKGPPARARFFAPRYWAGDAVCGAHQDGWHLAQKNASACASQLSESADTLLRRYYGPDLSIVRPGANDITGDGLGDSVSVMVDAETGALTTTLLTADKRATAAALPGGATTPLLPTGSIQRIGDLVVLDRALADVDGDRRNDLVQLIGLRDGRFAVQVLRATSHGFGRPRTWWSSDPDDAAIGRLGLRLVRGDFDGDLRDDVGLLQAAPYTPRGPGSASATTVLIVLRSTGRGLASALTWWHRAADLSTARLLVGDLTGDGRADLVTLGQANDGAATKVSISPSRTRPGLGAQRRWARLEVRLADVTAVLGDVDRDGQDDLILGRRLSHDRLSVMVLRTREHRARADTWWTSRPGFSWLGSRIATADLDRDGRTDGVIYRRDANGGTIVYRLMNDGDGFTLRLWRRLPGLAWDALKVL